MMLLKLACKESKWMSSEQYVLRDKKSYCSSRGPNSFQHKTILLSGQWGMRRRQRLFWAVEHLEAGFPGGSGVGSVLRAAHKGSPCYYFVFSLMMLEESRRHPSGYCMGITHPIKPLGEECFLKLMDICYRQVNPPWLCRVGKGRENVRWNFHFHFRFLA